MKWSFAEIWNKSLEQGKPERKLEPRTNIWASEVGGSFIDRYLKMTAVKPTNPPNSRSRRKFEAGNLMEWIVGLVLKRAGILIDSQRWVSFNYPGLLTVTGKSDFNAGGKPDWSKARVEIDALNLPYFFHKAAEDIAKYLSEKYPEGLAEVVLEIKSCSSFMYEKYESKGCDEKHAMQNFHYLKSENRPEGQIIYISRDDLRMLQFGVSNPSEVEAIYKADIEQMTKYINAKEQPPKELEIMFDEKSFKFSKNWRVEYSNYLTMLYGYERPDLYDERYKKQVASFNRTFGRCVQDKKMTKLNLEVIGEIKKAFPQFDDLVSKAKESHIELEEEDNDG